MLSRCQALSLIYLKWLSQEQSLDRKRPKYYGIVIRKSRDLACSGLLVFLDINNDSVLRGLNVTSHCFDQESILLQFAMLINLTVALMVSFLTGATDPKDIDHLFSTSGAHFVHINTKWFFYLVFNMSYWI